MGAALATPCSVKLDRVEEPSPISPYPGGGGGSTSSNLSLTRDRSSSSEQRVQKDNSAKDAALKRHSIDERTSSRKNSDSSNTSSQKRPPPILLVDQHENTSSEVDGGTVSSKVSIEVLSNNISNHYSPKGAIPSINLPNNNSVNNVSLSPQNLNHFNNQSSKSPTKQDQLPSTIPSETSSNIQQHQTSLPIPSQTLHLRSLSGNSVETARSGSNVTDNSTPSEEPPSLQPIRRAHSPHSPQNPTPQFNSPTTPVNIPSTPTRSTSTRNRPHYLSKLSSPPIRVNSPTMISALRQSKDAKSNSDGSIFDCSSSFTFSDTTELNVVTPKSSKKSVSSSSGSELHPHSLKPKSSSSASISSAHSNTKTMKDQIEESVKKFNVSIGTNNTVDRKVMLKRRHSVLASGRNSPSLFNELKQNEKADSICSPLLTYNPTISIGKSNFENHLQERRFSEIVAPLSNQHSPATPPPKNGSRKSSKNLLKSPTIVEHPNNPTSPAARSPARRRMSISVSPQHKVEMTTTAQVGRDQHGRKTINQYTIIKKLGKGSYGTVKLVKTQSGQLAAIKVINRSLLNNIKKKWSAPGQQQNNQISKIKLEIAILKNLDHPNIVQLIEVIDDPMNDKICLVFEYIDGGELMKLNDDGVLVDGTPFTEDEARYYFRQMLNSLEYLHFNRVVHRDIKPSNILLTKTRDIKLSDFGVSKLLEEDEEDTLDDSQGTPAFLPPEACYKGKIQGRPADIWALGITLYCMVTGKVPFRSDEAGASKLLYLYYVIQHEQPVMPDNLSPELEDIISRMLDKNPKTRITMDDLQEHPWVTKDEEEPFMEEPQQTLGELYPDFASQYLDTRRRSAIPTNRTYVHHTHLRKKHSTRKVVVDSEDIDNAIKEKEYDPNAPKKPSVKKGHLNHNVIPEKISLVRNRSSCKILITPEVTISVPTIEISAKTE